MSTASPWERGLARFSLEIEAQRDARDTAMSSRPMWRSTSVPSGSESAGSSQVTGLVIRYNRVHDFGHCRDEDHSMYLDQVNGAQIYGNWIYNIGYGAGSSSGHRPMTCTSPGT